MPELSFAYPVWIAVVASYHYILARQPRTPMLKFVVVLVRKANWDAASFRKYFVEVHGPMAQRIPGLRQYRQNFPVRDANRSYPRWDGVIELYFDDYDSMQRAWQSAEGVQATKDLEVFSDLALSSWSVVDEINVALTNKQNPRKSV